jgi:hypothetical protein
MKQYNLNKMTYEEIENYANKWVNNYCKKNKDLKKATWVKTIMVLGIIRLLNDIKSQKQDKKQ